jgi:hypothetical protein
MPGGTTHIIRGGTPVKWGTEGVESAKGVITSVTDDDNIQYEKIENNQGAVVGVVIYDTETSIKVDIMADPSQAKPVAGNMLSASINGIEHQAVVIKVGRTRGNKSFMVYSVEATAWQEFTGA